MATSGFDNNQTTSFTDLNARTPISHYSIVSKIDTGGRAGFSNPLQVR